MFIRYATLYHDWERQFARSRFPTSMSTFFACFPCFSSKVAIVQCFFCMALSCKLKYDVPFEWFNIPLTLIQTLIHLIFNMLCLANAEPLYICKFFPFSLILTCSHLFSLFLSDQCKLISNDTSFHGSRNTCQFSPFHLTHRGFLLIASDTHAIQFNIFSELVTLEIILIGLLLEQSTVMLPTVSAVIRWADFS